MRVLLTYSGIEDWQAVIAATNDMTIIIEKNFFDINYHLHQLFFSYQILFYPLSHRHPFQNQYFKVRKNARHDKNISWYLTINHYQ
ncbi:Uncharacterised protein [Salmonella enterica subsp. enterica]|uniref:Uncharacterized protein n=2 Tax=Salmonella enterica TaxID=28901 RepID=A0A379VNR5_SALET|nr:Uncharacterised protein [Salmonella enterica subsp. enterica]